jgi:hypothetical protein
MNNEQVNADRGLLRSAVVGSHLFVVRSFVCSFVHFFCFLDEAANLANHVSAHGGPSVFLGKIDTLPAESAAYASFRLWRFDIGG